MESYFSLIPKEILELIVYRLNNDDLQSFLEVDSNIRKLLDWSIVNSYHVGNYKPVRYGEYIRWLNLERLKEKLELRSSIEDLITFTVLDLHGYGIKVIPPEIGSLKYLKKIDFSRSQIREIPPEIGKLTSLQKLNLSRNLIRKIPPEIGSLTSLQYLHLGYNQIEVIPPEIGKLESLKELYLDENQIREIPPEIGSLKSLHFLNIYFNQIKEIPPELKHTRGVKINF